MRQASNDRETWGTGWIRREYVGVIVVGVVCLLLSTGTVGAAPTDASTLDDGNESTAGAVDVVFVLDRSDSMATERYEFRREVPHLAERLDGVDARYGLVVYNGEATVERELTTDFAAVEDAMDVPLRGTTENASTALLTASTMDLRSDAETVVVLVSDEDDDSSAERRAEAQSVLDDASVVLFSPSSPEVSSCEFHSPPCDDSADNELRGFTSTLDGEWYDVGGDIEPLVRDAAAYVETAATVETTETIRTSDSDGPQIREVSLGANRTDVTVGEPVGFEAVVENAGDGVGDYDAQVTTATDIFGREEVRLGPGETERIEITHAFAEPGTFEVFVSHEFAARVTVSERPATAVETNVSANGTAMTATVTEPRAGSPVSVPVERLDGVTAQGNGSAALTNVTITPTTDRDFRLNVTAAATAPNATEPMPEGVAGAAYLTVNSSLPAERIANVTVTATAATERASLYRYGGNESEWTELNATVHDVPTTETAGTTGNETVAADSRLVARTSGFSTFAVGVPQPDFQVAGAWLNASDVTAGEPVAVTTSVRNTGQTNGTYTGELTANGTVVATESVTVPVGGTRTVHLTFTPAEPGQYTLAAGDGTARTLVVAPGGATADAEAMATETATETRTEPPATAAESAAEPTTDAADDGAADDGTTSGAGPGFGPLSALVALSAVLIVRAASRQS